MSVSTLAALLCAIKVLISPGQWDANTCVDHAKEYIEVSNKYSIDPLVLVSINIYECDMEDYRDVIYSSSKGIIARDICPTGLRIKKHLYQTRGGYSFHEVLDKSAKLLASYKQYHNKHCTDKNHSYLQHYNTGYKNHDNNYDNQVLEIYTALRSGKSTLSKKINLRAREIAHNIRRITSHEKLKDIYKDCNPRSSCTVAKNWSNSSSSSKASSP